MALGAALSAGFVLGFIADVYALVLAASFGVATAALLAFDAGGALPAARAAALTALMLQMGFGAALAVQAVRRRQIDRRRLAAVACEARRTLQ